MIWTEQDQTNIKKRDPDTFGRVYKAYSEKIYNFLLIKVEGNKNIADEIFSETFHSALKSVEKLNDINKIFTWLLQIANRRYYDFLRKKYREKKYFNLNNNDSIIENTSDHSVEKKIEAQFTENRIKLVKIALESLRPQYKEVIKLKYNDHKKQKEIAELLNKTESAVENLLYKARASLKKQIKKLT